MMCPVHYSLSHSVSDTHTQSHLGLEGAVECGEEVRSAGERQDPPLHQGALGVLILEEHVLLQHLHRKQALRATLLSQ